LQNIQKSLSTGQEEVASHREEDHPRRVEPSDRLPGLNVMKLVYFVTHGVAQ